MRKKRQVAAVTAEQCVEALRKRYPAVEYAFFEQVANGTGFRADRWADVVVMSLWPSRGLTLSGFEVKVSRTDWLRELKDPAKSAKVQRYCDEWWIVAPKGLIDVQELPKTWGLLEVIDDKGGRKVKRAAPPLEAEPMTRAFIAALLRRASDDFERVLCRERAEARRTGAEQGAPDLQHQLQEATASRDRLARRLEEFEEASGISITNDWDLGNVAEIVKTLRHQRGLDVADRIRQAAGHWQSIASSLLADAERIESLEKRNGA